MIFEAGYDILQDSLKLCEGNFDVISFTVFGLRSKELM